MKRQTLIDLIGEEDLRDYLLNLTPKDELFELLKNRLTLKDLKMIAEQYARIRRENSH